MTPDEIRKEFHSLYSIMANSHDVAYMRTFGNVHKEMMEWFIANKPAEAQEWIDKLESIRWNNYLTPKEAEKIVSAMKPSAPWSREKWRDAMSQHGYKMEEEPCYNSCALWVTMNMIMSDSSKTLEKYVGGDKLFDAVYDLAIDKLCDEDERFSIRHYFNL